MSDGWVLGFALNAVVGAAFLTISLMLAVQLTRSRQWGLNRIGSYFTVLVGLCGAGHAMRAGIGLGGALGFFGTAGTGTQLMLADWHLWIPDALAAASGVFYVIARVQDRDILSTTRAFEDVRSRRRKAISVHDGVTQKLLASKIALEQGNRTAAREALHEGLEASKQIVSPPERVAGRRGSEQEDAA